MDEYSYQLRHTYSDGSVHTSNEISFWLDDATIPSVQQNSAQTQQKSARFSKTARARGGAQHTVHRAPNLEAAPERNA